LKAGQFSAAHPEVHSPDGGGARIAGIVAAWKLNGGFVAAITPTSPGEHLTGVRVRDA